MTIIGLDIGGTKIDGICWKNGKILRAEKVRTPKNRKAFLGAVENLVRRLRVADKINGIGVAVAGTIDLKRGVIIKSPNMKFLGNLHIADFLAKKFRVAIKVDNDTKSFLRAETKFGRLRGKKNAIALTLGTGVGGAVMVGGQLLRGSHVSAVELGHIIIGEGKSGEHQTLEDLASGHAFEKLKNHHPLYWQKRAERGDAKAKKIYDILGRNLGAGLASLANIFDPEIVVLGGGISRAHRLFLSSAKKVMEKYTRSSIVKPPPVVISRLAHAGPLGGVALFR